MHVCKCMCVCERACTCVSIIMHVCEKRVSVCVHVVSVCESVHVCV